MDTVEATLLDILSRHKSIRLAMLFGSRALGTERSDSDLDIALLADIPLSAQVKLKLAEDIGSGLGCPVDIVDLYTAGEPILGQALKGIRLMGDSQTYAKLLNRHLLNEADFMPLQRRILAERRNAWINR
jgi:predicted nucleotidyltransferase